MAVGQAAARAGSISRVRDGLTRGIQHWLQHSCISASLLPAPSLPSSAGCHLRWVGGPLGQATQAHLRTCTVQQPPMYHGHDYAENPHSRLTCVSWGQMGDVFGTRQIVTYVLIHVCYYACSCLHFLALQVHDAWPCSRCMHLHVPSDISGARSPQWNAQWDAQWDAQWNACTMLRGVPRHVYIRWAHQALGYWGSACVSDISAGHTH